MFDSKFHTIFNIFVISADHKEDGHGHAAAADHSHDHAAHGNA